MEEPTRPSALAAAAGISISYASEIIAAKRAPGRALAVHIFRTTGRRFGPLIGLSASDIDTLERIEAARRPAPVAAEAR